MAQNFQRDKERSLLVEEIVYKMNQSLENVGYSQGIFQLGQNIKYTQKQFGGLGGLESDLQGIINTKLRNLHLNSISKTLNWQKNFR